MAEYDENWYKNKILDYIYGREPLVHPEDKLILEGGTKVFILGGELLVDIWY